MERALRSTNRMRHASLLLRGGSVVGYGFNHGDRHSESVALGKVWPNRRKGLTLVNIRLTPAGELGMARPCAKCWALLLESGVKKVTYSADGGTFMTERIV